MYISLDETRRIDALKMAIEYGNSSGLDLEETIEAAKKFEEFLKGEINAQN